MPDLNSPLSLSLLLTLSEGDLIRPLREKNDKSCLLK